MCSQRPHYPTKPMLQLLDGGGFRDEAHIERVLRTRINGFIEPEPEPSSPPSVRATRTQLIVGLILLSLGVFWLGFFFGLAL